MTLPITKAWRILRTLSSPKQVKALEKQCFLILMSLWRNLRGRTRCRAVPIAVMIAKERKDKLIVIVKKEYWEFLIDQKVQILAKGLKLIILKTNLEAQLIYSVLKF